MTKLLFRTITLVLLLATAGAAAGCSGVPQDGRYQTHGNASWDNWRG
ncbi:MAG: hypothetical protein ACK4JB_07725 [Reyranella sp.]